MPALCYAARSGEVAAIKTLAAGGKADVNARGWGGMSPLMFACASNADGAVAELLALGADVWAEDDAKNTALHFACRGGLLTCMLPLLDAAAKSGAGAAAYANARNAAGRTALHVAANHGQAACITLLLKRDADAEVKDAKGNTALVSGVVVDHAAHPRWPRHRPRLGCRSSAAALLNASPHPARHL
jgi:ankyrin repeat protein